MSFAVGRVTVDGEIVAYFISPSIGDYYTRLYDEQDEAERMCALPADAAVKVGCTCGYDPIRAVFCVRYANLHRTFYFGGVICGICRAILSISAKRWEEAARITTYDEALKANLGSGDRAELVITKNRGHIVELDFVTIRDIDWTGIMYEHKGADDVVDWDYLKECYVLPV